MKRTRIILNKQTTIHVSDMSEREKEIFEQAGDDGFAVGLITGVGFCILLFILITFFPIR